jgi:HK97 family phage prohead protease
VTKEKDDTEPYDESDFRSMQTRADVEDLSEGDLVSWDSAGGTAYGMVETVATGETVSGNTEPEDTEHETSEDNPGVIIELVERDDEGEVVGTGDTVFHRPDTVTMADESDVPEDRSARGLEGQSYHSRINDPEIRETADGTITVKVMTDQVARDGMVIDPEGLRTEDYMKNPVVLWEHGQDPRRGAEPVARCTNLMRKDDGYVAEIEFAEDDFAQRIEGKMRNEFINAVSVGWKTEDVRREERGENMIPVVRESDMTEFSVVGVPADTDALVQSRMHGPPATSEEPVGVFETMCQGLIVAEATRRTQEGMTMAQAKEAVRGEIKQEVPGGMDEVRFTECPFDGMPDPMRSFETLGAILEVGAGLLMRAAEVDGCMYDTDRSETERSETGEESRTSQNDENSRSDCGCTGEGTPSSPSVSGGTPPEAERDDAPGIEPLVRLAQEIGAERTKKIAERIGIGKLKRLVSQLGAGRVAKLRRKRADRKAKRQLGVL